MSAPLKANPTLADFQAYAARKIRERGFDQESVQDKFILLVEEVGELAKALRPMHGVKVASDSVTGEIEHEIADVFWLLLALSNGLDIDLEQAVRAKDAKNEARSWS